MGVGPSGLRVNSPITIAGTGQTISEAESAPEFRLFPSANGVPAQEGKRASFDFRKLYADDPVATGGIPKL